AYACLGCNWNKADKTTVLDPYTSEPTGLFHPRRHKWPDHFAWNNDFTLIHGITPIGRATSSRTGFESPGHREPSQITDQVQPTSASVN
ncbi:MAG: hypothetical protein LH647_06055, partial [Leptolyngbyaceae cyanobacterium CAN_BIN12]|nr:hypothetical protein [Leptolyngbyaceae cyanobacterium CAN_BIN12]